MRIGFVVFILLLTASRMFAQDLIVTNEGDSINCKITSIKSDYLYFTFKHKGELRNTLLPISNTKTYAYQYYSTPAISPEQVQKLTSSELFPHWRFAFSGGWSYRTATVANNLPSAYKTYVEGLLSGYHFSGEGAYYYSEHFGAGLKCSLANFSNSASNMSLTLKDGTSVSGDLSDDISISYIGPYFTTRFLNKEKKNAFFMNMGIGYLGYRDNMKLNGNYTITGSTAGFVFDVGYDIGLSPNASIGFQLSLLSGSLNSIDFSNGTKSQTINLGKDEYESLNRIDLSIGLRFGSSK